MWLIYLVAWLNNFAVYTGWVLYNYTLMLKAISPQTTTRKCTISEYFEVYFHKLFIWSDRDMDYEQLGVWNICKALLGTKL